MQPPDMASMASAAFPAMSSGVPQASNPFHAGLGQMGQFPIFMGMPGADFSQAGGFMPPAPASAPEPVGPPQVFSQSPAPHLRGGGG